MEKPLASVVIPTYRGSETLERAIKSVLDQNYRNYEVVVVDDNDPQSESRIATASIMIKYANDPQVKYVKHDKNSNGSVARNTGAKIANGKYLFFLDDDDYYYPDRMGKCIKELEAGADICFSYVEVYLRNRLFKTLKLSEEQDYFLPMFLNDNYIGTGSNIAIRKDIYDKVGGFDETLVRKQDYDFLLCTFNRGYKPAIIKEVLVRKYVEDRNTPSYEDSKKINDYIITKYKDAISRYSVENQNEIYEYLHWSLFKTAVHNKDKVHARYERIFLNNRLRIRDRMDLLICYVPFLSAIKSFYYAIRRPYEWLKQ